MQKARTAQGTTTETTLAQQSYQAGLRQRIEATVQANSDLLERVAMLEHKTIEELISEFSVKYPLADWKSELEHRLQAASRLAAGAKAVIGRAIVPRGDEFGMVELNCSLEIGLYKWQPDQPGPVEYEPKTGCRFYLLPFSSANIGIYLGTDLATPFQDISIYIDTIRQKQSQSLMLGEMELESARLLSNRWELSGGLHARILAFGSGKIWRGLFGSVGYRGSLWGGKDHGIEAGFGIEVWRLRLGGTYFKSISGPLKDSGGQLWGVRLEFRLFSELGKTGI